MRARTAYLAVAALLAVSPLFLILSDMVGYHEPLDIVAEVLGLEDISEKLTWTPLFDYSVPGLPPELGYVVAGAIGVAALIALGKAIERMAK